MLTRLFWALARFIGLSGAALQLATLYAVEDQVRTWLTEHRDITTIALTIYVVCELLYLSLSAEAAKVA